MAGEKKASEKQAAKRFNMADSTEGGENGIDQGVFVGALYYQKNATTAKKLGETAPEVVLSIGSPGEEGCSN